MKNWHKIPAVWLLALVSSVPSHADPSAPNSNPQVETQSKPYMLFMGADLSVEYKGRACSIKGVTDKGFVVEADGRRVTVSPDREDLNIQGKQALKVAPTGIAISKVGIERAYAPGHFAAKDASGLSAKMESERYHANVLIATMSNALSASPSTYGPDPKSSVPALNSDYSSTQSTMLADNSFSMQNPAAAGGGGDFDAFQLNFDISSRTPATGVYVMLVIHGRESADKAGPGRIWFLGQNIGDVGPNAKTVRIVRGGFPPGYALIGVDVHVYDERAELATNVAPKRMEITADEAFELSVADYVSRHRGADAQPVQAGAGLPAAVRARLSADQIGRTYYVRIGRNGLFQGAFLDEACTLRVSEEPLTSALAGMRFYPAIKAGKPVEAVVPVRL